MRGTSSTFSFALPPLLSWVMLPSPPLILLLLLVVVVVVEPCVLGCREEGGGRRKGGGEEVDFFSLFGASWRLPGAPVA